MRRKIGLLTGGGDVPPLNSVIHSCVERAKSADVEVVGIAKGWHGLLEKETVNLGQIHHDPLIGGTILRSARINLAAIERSCERVVDSLSSLGLDGLIVIGGDDTLSNAFLLPDIPQVLISKTIDNDVGVNREGNVVNYFTLGYPTAAEKISSFVSLKEGLRTTAYSHERIIVVESMGMHAGWLALASAMGHPDFIVVPEFPLDYPLLRSRIVDRFHARKNVVLVVSEGARWEDGSYIAADENELDDFGHPRFRGAAETLAGRLKEDLKEYFNTRNVNFVNPSYLYRSGRPNSLDYVSANALGNAAVNLFLDGITSPVFLALEHVHEKFVPVPIEWGNMNGIEKFHRFIGKRYYDPDEFTITAEGKEYMKKIIREVEEPQYGIY